MKYIVFAIALAVASSSAVLAGEKPTKAQNEALIKTGHQTLTSKTGQLEAKVKANDQQAVATLAAEVQTLLQQGMMQYKHQVHLLQGTEQKDANKQFLQLERLSYQYRQLATNANANGDQLVSKAKAFLAIY
jgi:hypothetical protein